MKNSTSYYKICILLWGQSNEKLACANGYIDRLTINLIFMRLLAESSKSEKPVLYREPCNKAAFKLAILIFVNCRRTLLWS
jgi:hypothetical protein